MQAQLLFPAAATLGEGPLWWNDTLHWVDILSHTFHAWRPGHSAPPTRVTFDEEVGAVVPCRSGSWIVALASHLRRYDAAFTPGPLLAAPERGSTTRFNDAKADAAGRLWAGTLHRNSRPEAALYSITPDGTCTPALRPLTLSNGLAWAPDNRTFYHIDTPTRRVDAFDFDLATGALSNRRTVVDLASEKGFPDGMTIDADGNLWIALWDGHAVLCADPRSRTLLHRVHVPAPFVTSCTFGGPNLDHLFITTARLDRKDPNDPSGHLFVATPGVRGLPAFTFSD